MAKNRLSKEAAHAGRIALAVSSLVLGLSLSAAAQTPPAQRFMTIGTGGVTGVYFPAGGAICRLVNGGRRSHGLRCTVESTAGSVANVAGLRSGEIDFGLVQSDAQYEAVKGTGPFKDAGPFDELRSVFSLHPELVTLVVRPDLPVSGVPDLKSKRVNVGNAGSGTRGSVETLLAAVGLKVTDFALAAELRPDAHGPALCESRIDAFFFLVGHPSANIQDPTSACGARIVSIEGPAVDKLVADLPYLSKATVPANMYRANTGEVRTYGVRATFLTTTRLPADQVHLVAKAVIDGFEELKRLHPALENLVLEEMASASLTAPLHEGALKAFREKGLLK